MNTPPRKKRGLVAVPSSMELSRAKTRATPEAGDKKGHFYRPLPAEFRHNGSTFRQIAREKNAAIYEQKWCKCTNPSVAYEVIRIRRREGFHIAGRFVEPAEVYPNSEAWGLDGFTVTDKGAVFLKLRKITHPLKESANPVKKSPIQNTERCLESKELRGDVNGRLHG
jgi:hypothetical protein